ncbi:MAG: hypothetical protein KY469_16025 [Actinobacteria bacterium]|nr:hypothetical protein [Actinomycetota bacterium]
MAAEDVARIVQRWTAVLEELRRRSMRVHAIFSEARPHAFARGVLTLAFQPRHAGFHAEEAKKGHYADTLKEAVKTILGEDVRVDTTVLDEDEEDPGAPSRGATDPVAVEDDEVAVVEAEYAPPVDADEAAQTAADLLVTELDAEPVD